MKSVALFCKNLPQKLGLMRIVADSWMYFSSFEEIVQNQTSNASIASFRRQTLRSHRSNIKLLDHIEQAADLSVSAIEAEESHLPAVLIIETHDIGHGLAHFI